MNRRVAVGVLVGLASLLPGGCEHGGPSGPPSIRLGKDECGECGMIISEDRCSCALIVERQGTGERESVVFDDIGCLLDHERDHGADERVVGGYVHDHGTREWVPMEQATYVLAASRDVLRTPMGSGLIAFARREDAEKACGGLRGELMGRAGAVAAREAWRAARRGGSSGTP